MAKWENKLASMIKEPAAKVSKKDVYTTGVVEEISGTGYRITSAQGQITLTEQNSQNVLDEALYVGDTVVILGSYLNGKKPVILAKRNGASGDTYSSPFTTSPAIQNEILECALGYYRHQHNLIYGNTYVATNMAYNPGDTPHRNTDGTKRYEIDCSSFAQLITSGVNWEDSRYNEDNTENTRKHDWGFDWANKEQYYCKFEAGQDRMLAHDMAAYCRDRGWLFKPRLGYDFTNLQTGDLLFFQQATEEAGYWQNIRHIGIFLWANGYGNVMILDASTSHPAGVMVVRTRVISTPYASQIIWAARLPYDAQRADDTPTDILKNPEDYPRSWVNTTTKFLADIKLKEDLAPYNYYTVAVKVQQDEEQYPQDICIRLSGMNDTMDRKMRPYTIEPDGTYIFRFFITDDDCVANRPDGELEINGYDHSHILLNGYAYDEEGEFISEGALQINTVVEWAKVYKGIWTPNRQWRDVEKQDKLTAGANITIDENNVISAKGGGSGTTYSAGTGIKISGKKISTRIDDDTIKFDENGAMYANNQTEYTDLTAAPKTAIGTLTVGGTSYTVNQQDKPKLYAYCETAAATAIKDITINNYTLTTGDVITVRFRYANTATLPKLRINGGTEYSICYAGSSSAGVNWWRAGQAVGLIFDSAQFIYPGGLASTTYWGMTRLSSATDESSETLAATPKAIKTVKDAIPTVSGTANYANGTTIGTLTVNSTTTTYNAPYWVAATDSVITVGTSGYRREIDMSIDETKFSWWPTMKGANYND